MLVTKFSFLWKSKGEHQLSELCSHQKHLSVSSLTSAGTLSSACLWQRLEAMASSVAEPPFLQIHHLSNELLRFMV